MKNILGRITILVDDYDTAAAFYEKNFGFKRLFDAEAGNGRRYLHLGPDEPNAAGIWLLKAEGDTQEALIGSQTGEQPAMVIYTSDLKTLYEQLQKNAVSIKTPPVTMQGYDFLHCHDNSGNEIVVAELKP